tara:strand:- start:3546 stop:3710 length:165 start_codon:yes stop_codon:yes gene_type:complete
MKIKLIGFTPEQEKGFEKELNNLQEKLEREKDSQMSKREEFLFRQEQEQLLREE